MQCIPTYRDLCVDGSWWNLVGFQIKTRVFPVLALRCADGLWGLSPHQLNMILHRWSYITHIFCWWSVGDVPASEDTY